MKLKPNLTKQILALVGLAVLAIAFINMASLDSVNEVISANVGQLRGHDLESGKSCELEISKNPDFDLKSDDGSPVEFYVISKSLDPAVRIAVYADNYGPDNSKWHVAYKDAAIEYIANYSGSKQRKIKLHFDKHTRRIHSAELLYDVSSNERAASETCSF